MKPRKLGEKPGLDTPLFLTINDSLPEYYEHRSLKLKELGGVLDFSGELVS